ncbi:MAG: hypothetical protein E7645_02600 [Ruminococcaceae bacterium]|nr:hypothetical protein [Oscillospiraceae bacterium]
MILNEKRTTVAYRCPHCGGGVLSAVGLFKLSADLVKLKCTCGQSHLEIFYNRDNTVRLRVPCMICATPHNFTVSTGVFFSDELFVLPCPYSDINICFTGEMNLVKAELARTELMLIDLLEEHGISDFSALHGQEETLSDPQIRDIVMFVINDMDEEGKIYCRCHPEGSAAEPISDGDRTEDIPGRYEAEITKDGILVSCRECGASRLIPTDSSLSAHAFLNSDSLKLE